jgi:hypothetical protein
VIDLQLHLPQPLPRRPPWLRQQPLPDYPARRSLDRDHERLLHQTRVRPHAIQDAQA